MLRNVYIIKPLRHPLHRWFMFDEMLKEFYDIGKSLSSEKDTVKLFEKIINSSLKLTSADAGTIYIVVDKKTGEWSNIQNGSIRGKLLKFVIARNTSMNVNLQDFTAQISKKSIFGFTVISGKSVKINDAYKIGNDVDYRHDNTFDNNTGYRTKSILSIPMKNHDNDITGVIQLINKKRRWDTAISYDKDNATGEILPFNDTDELIMNSLAGQAAVALENSQLYRDLKGLLKVYRQQNNHLLYLSKNIMKAHEEERKRIAREIHDGPAQSAVNLSFKLEICKRYLSDGKIEDLYSEMNNFSDAIHSTVNEIRTIIYDLKPSCLEDGLISAVQRHIETFSASSGINIDFTFSGNDSAVEYYMTSTIYRIVQEALSNVKKHAEAENIGIELAITNARITLDIADDGKGFVVEELQTRKFDRLKGGFGIEGIRERVELIRGGMTIQSAPGQGTALHIDIPLT
ncbi:MAG: GAF domain-containing sensor histidine kinase [Ruminiclostridium sp.]|nr:GAF domain-containing sensor histidine kinase [Ruminiclostridium sp.]